MNNCSCGFTGGCYLCNPNMHNPPNYKITPVIPFQKGWECPRCSRIYGPNTLECWTCNSFINNGLTIQKIGGQP